MSSPKRHQENYLPPMLLDAFGGRRAPGTRTPPAQERHNRKRSTSRERSLTPFGSSFGSPKSADMSLNLDAPPTQSMRSPSKAMKLEIHSPSSAMSVDLITPLTNTVTLIGVPSHRQDWLIKQFLQCGPIYQSRKSDKPDGNWIVLTFQTREGAILALENDGRTYDQSWIVCVKTGDLFGNSPYNVPPVRPSSPQSNLNSPLSNLTSPLAHKMTTRSQSVLIKDKLMTPEVRRVEDFSFSPKPAILPKKQVIAEENSEIRPAGILSRIFDFILTW